MSRNAHAIASLPYLHMEIDMCWWDDCPSDAAFFYIRLRVEKLKTALPSKPNETQPEAKSASVSKNGHAAPSQKKSSRGRGLAKWGLQGRVLLQRSWRQIKRDKATNVARVMSNVSSAIIFGSIYWRMGKKQIAVQNRMGLLQVRAFKQSSNEQSSASAQFLNAVDDYDWF